MEKEIRFLSNNKFKIQEVSAILERADYKVIPVNEKICELQTDDVEILVKDKAIKAYKKVGRPIFVEHTGLYLNVLKGKLPGGLTQVFWDNLGADAFSILFGKTDGSSKAKAITVIGYVDGKQFYLFKGEVEGCIVDVPRGDRSFQWDCVFQPKGFDKTFAELGVEKNNISMRKKAFDLFIKYLQDE